MNAATLRRVAVIGSGIAGLSAAWRLRDQAQVTLFEASHQAGGHANTLEMSLGGLSHGVDTGFLVFNERTYPGLIALFAELGVEVAPSEMSFSVQAPGLEWSGSDLNTVFAQRSNLLRPKFWAMLADILRFNRLCTALAQAGQADALAEPLGEFLRRQAFGAPFQSGYLLPMLGCIWSCPTDQMLHFPVGTLIRFCHNHGLLQVQNRPRWFTVRGGSRHYVQRLLARLPASCELRLNSPVRSVRPLPPSSGQAGVWVDSAQGSERFDAVILASHSDQSLALLPDASPAEQQVLGAIRYQNNRAVLHTDASVLPQRRLAWAAWNYERAPELGREQARVCLHYLINRLQPLPWEEPVIVSLNPVREPQAARVHAEIDYAHPVFDHASVAAQRCLPSIQGQRGLWFCGAWAGYGFHEDGLQSGQAAAQGLLAQWAEPARWPTCA
jgi:predicted NAD/FAD-binding protein